jgi:hypothetical protein
MLLEKKSGKKRRTQIQQNKQKEAKSVSIF